MLSLVGLLAGISAMYRNTLYQISGWKFDDLGVMIQKHLCEALYALGRTEEAGESLLRIVGEDVCVDGPIATWASGELSCTCLSAIRF